MAGRGMGAATKGGGCVEKGGMKTMKKTSQTTGPIMMAKGGMAKKMMGGGMMKYAKGGMAKGGCK